MAPAARRTDAPSDSHIILHHFRRRSFSLDNLATATSTRPPLHPPHPPPNPAAQDTSFANCATPAAKSTPPDAAKAIPTNMARKSNVDSDGPSTGEGSGPSDVEMQDRDDKMHGFKKFGVSTGALFACRFTGQTRMLTSPSQYYQDTPDYTVQCPCPPAIALPRHADALY